MSTTFRQSLRTYRRLLGFMRPYRGRLVLAILCSIVFGGSQFLVIKLIEPLFNGVILEQKPEIIRSLPLLILGLYLVRGLIQYTQIYLMHYVGHRTIMDVRNRLFRHLTRLPLEFFREKETGVLVSRVTNDTLLVQAGVTAVLREALIHSVEIVALTAWIFMVSLKMAAVGCLLLPVSLLPLVQFAKKLRRASHATQERMADMSSTLVETLLGIQVVKAFNMEHHQTERFETDTRGFFNAIMKAARVQAISPPLMEFVGAIAVAGIVGFGGYLMQRGEITAAQFGQFVAALTMLYKPVKNLSKANHNLQQSISAGERVFRILDDHRRIEETQDAPPLEELDDAVRYEEVDFRYDQEPTLQGINLTARRGEKIALVGSSGSGKTSLVNLLPRFYDPSAGRITIDGTDIRELSLHSLRDCIGIVGQETTLFNATVRENILFGAGDAAEGTVEAAARAAYADDFIRRLPEGYESIIGERGARLSGGERQRIAIARALLKDPPILILDEATSALDTESESIIQKALDHLMENRTTFVVAHRLSTIRSADRIHVLERGSIVESGNHEELLAREGRYRELHDLQFRATRGE